MLHASNEVRSSPSAAAAKQVACCLCNKTATNAPHRVVRHRPERVRVDTEIGLVSSNNWSFSRAAMQGHPYTPSAMCSTYIVRILQLDAVLLAHTVKSIGCPVAAEPRPWERGSSVSTSLQPMTATTLTRGTKEALKVAWSQCQLGSGHVGVRCR
jgi:hypothetical protein